jgi:hypothetical protein
MNLSEQFQTQPNKMLATGIFLFIYLFVYLFIYLFVVNLKIISSNSDYVASNEEMISKWWIGKDLEGSGCGIIEGIILVFA